MGILLALVVLAVTAIMLSPVALSSRDLLTWAGAPTGLGLPNRWPVLVILSLDAAAIACVLMSVLCTWRGERPGIFSLLIWLFAFTSAFANWRHALTPNAPPDAAWFFPAMSLTGPGILEVVLHRVRSWLHDDDSTTANPGDNTRPGQAQSWQRWIPGLGSFTDTFGAHRTKLLVPELNTFTAALQRYHELCPDGSVRVAKALRHQHLAQAQARTLTSLQGTPTATTTSWPVDLMKRIPVHTEAYQRWQAAWRDLHRADQQLRPDERPSAATLQAIAVKHGISNRQMQFIRRAGELSLLDSPVPPAVRLAQLTDANKPTARTSSTSTVHS